MSQTNGKKVSKLPMLQKVMFAMSAAIVRHLLVASNPKALKKCETFCPVSFTQDFYLTNTKYWTIDYRLPKNL